LGPELTGGAAQALRPSVVGVALGVLAFAAAAVLVVPGGGAAPAAALGATLLVSLAAGMWAGAPGAADGHPAWRWLAAAVALGTAAAFASAWGALPLQHTPLARALALLVLGGVPGYALGSVLPMLAADPEDDAADDAERRFGEAGRVAVWVVAGAALGVVLGGMVLFPRFAPGPVLAGVAVLVSAPFYFPHRHVDAGEENTLWEAETPFGAIRVAEFVFPGKRQPERRLYLNDEIESGEMVRTGAPTFAYIAAAERWLGEVARPGDSYLFLGGGAYTLPRRVAERDGTARITVVELDPEVTRAAYRWFGVRTEHGIASLHGDARSVADALPDASFDRIFVDVYDGSESIPYSLITRESWESVARLLRPGGCVLANVIGVADGEGDRRFWSTVRTFTDVFPDARLYLHLDRGYPDRQNFLLAAPVGDAPPLPSRAGLFDVWPRAEWSSPTGTVVFRDTTLVAASPERPRRDRTARRIE
jgi:hypothetical protein